MKTRRSDTPRAAAGDAMHAAGEILLPPRAPVLLEALRAVGYAFETAVADLVDNSISARATEVRIEFRAADRPHVAVIDDGRGMNREELVAAMRHGSQDPRAPRGELDLGRFGLGLKTASLSQCRCLTVASLQGGQLTAMRWDLDVVAARGDWILQELSEEAARSLPQVGRLLQRENGTMVLWEKLDRVADAATDLGRALGDHVDRTRDHLAMVFHRFFAAGGASPLRCLINGTAVPPVDPFLRSNPATQQLPAEQLRVANAVVTVQPFVLPHATRLSRQQKQLAGGEEGLRRKQGFYVYRNQRLVTWGTWFRVAPQEELSKLARVQVDIPNTLDHLWTLDIKKSTAFPPEDIRAGLRRIVERIRDRSRQVYIYRGRTQRTDTVATWRRVEDRDGVRYQLNPDHDLVRILRDRLDGDMRGILDALLRTIEAGVPFDAIYADMASERSPAGTPLRALDQQAPELEALARSMIAAIGPGTEEAERLLERLPTIEPFAKHIEIARHIQEALRAQR